MSEIMDRIVENMVEELDIFDPRFAKEVTFFVLRELLNPTKEMIEAGDWENKSYTGGGDAESIFTVMIEEAFKGGKNGKEI
jgi:hypothetical protein